MLVGVLSDTHGRLDTTRAAARMLSTFDVARVIHCGDIGSPDIPALLAAWPTDYVLGNVDHDVEGLSEAIESQPGHRCHGRFAELPWCERRLAVLHGDDSRRLAQTIATQQFDFVCFGHTHRSELRTEGLTTILNPGALHRAKRHSIAVLDLAELQAHVLEL